MFAVFQFFRQSLQVRFMAGLLALYLFDISADFQHSRALEEDLSVNEIETITELVLEEIANLGNLFDEQQESDREPFTKVSASLIYLVSVQLDLQTSVKTGDEKILQVEAYPFYAAPFSILTPPPRQA